jgi:hypothetical protein
MLPSPALRCALRTWRQELVRLLSLQGRLRRFTIGRYPAIKPAQARREAAAALERVAFTPPFRDQSG